MSVTHIWFQCGVRSPQRSRADGGQSSGCAPWGESHRHPLRGRRLPPWCPHRKWSGQLTLSIERSKSVLRFPERRLSASASEVQLEGAVGGLIGATLLGPFGALAAAALGGWLGRSVSSSQDGPRLRAALAQAFAAAEKDVRKSVDETIRELSGHLEEHVINHKLTGLRQHRAACEELRASLSEGQEERRQRVSLATQRLERLRNLRADLERTRKTP